MKSRTQITADPLLSPGSWHDEHYHRFRQLLLMAGFALCVFPVLAQQTNLAVVVRHSPNLNGSGLIEGSVQQLLGENATLNGGFTLTGDLLVPGTPTLKVNGNPTFFGTIVGGGSATPSGYQVTFNGNCSLHHLRTRTTPVSLATVPAPLQPAGTRSVTINNPSQSIGDPVTLRNLTLNGNVGQFVIPPGTYGNLAANGGSGFTIGIAGATTPAIYNLQNLTLNGQTRLDVVGPVILTVANGFTANGILGSTNNPSRLQLQLASGGFTLNGGCSVYGSVTAPAGTVIINGNSLLVGSAQCDRLIVNSGGIIRAGNTANQAPAANAQNLTVAEDTALSVTLTGSDAEGATLIYSVLSQPGHGTLTGAAPNLVYTPAQNFNGSDAFTFKVNDGQADSATATISFTIAPVNDAPTAQSQTISSPEDTSLNITLSGSDLESSLLTFQVITSPVHGTLSGTSPNLTYTPTANYTGSDSFTYKANDGQALSATATISITVNPVDDAPVASAQTVITDEDTAANITLTAVDVEGDGLDFTVLTQPAHGTLSGPPPNLVYTPATNYNGNDSFTFRASDAWLDSASAAVTLVIRPVSDTPVATAQTLSTLEDTATNLVLTATDVDGDTLSYMLVTSPSNGTLSGTTPELVFSPAADFHGTNTFTFVAADGNSTSAPVVITLIVTPVNDLPVADAKTISLDEDTMMNVVLTGMDVDGDVLSFTVPVPPTNGMLSGTSPNLIYTPNTNFNGADYFTYAANDGVSNSAPAAVALTIQPVNDAPLAVSQSFTTSEDSAQTLTLAGTDEDGDALSFQVITGPNHGSLSGTVPNLTYTPALNFHGHDPFSFIANDGQTNSTPSVITIVVSPVNDAPIATSQTITTDEEVAALIVLAGFDVDGDALTYLIGTSPTHGALSGVAPNLVYSPTAGYFGPDSFTFKVNDGTVDSAFANVSINVRRVNRSPVVSAGPDQTNSALQFVLSGNVTDDGLPAGASVAQQWSKISGPGTATFSDSTALSNVVTFSQAGVYFLRLTASDSELQATDDILVVANSGPQVDAGTNQTVQLGLSVVLHGSVTDDGLPVGQLETTWQLVSGPGQVMFADMHSAETSVTISGTGAYQFRLLANDSLITNSDDTVVTVTTANQPPLVSVGPKQLVMLPAAANLLASIADDGLPTGTALTFLWTKVSGPGDVTFTDPTATNTTATFSTAGDYVLRLAANDSELVGFADLRVVVRTPAMNEAPVVSAGSNLLIGLTNTVALNGFGSDDGLPQAGTLSFNWAVVSGPAAVTFANTSTTNTTASFSGVGTYVLRLTATDSLLSASADVTVTVYPFNQPPLVEAGNDQTVTIPAPVLFSPTTGQPLDPRVALQTSLGSVPRWNNVIGQPGLSLPVHFDALSYADGIVYAGSAGGNFQEDGTTNHYGVVARWNGTNWSGLYSPAVTHPGGPVFGYMTVPYNPPAGVNLVARGNEVFLSGGFLRNLNNDSQNEWTARWDGTAWRYWQVQVVSPLVIFGEFVARPEAIYQTGEFSFNPTNWTTGYNNGIGFPNLPVLRNAAAWDGTNWAAVGGGFDGTIFSAAVSPDNKLYVGGRFRIPTPSGMATNIAVWNGANWAPLGGGVFRLGHDIFGQPIDSNEVRAIAVGDDGNVYVGGDIALAGNVAVHNIARWDGTNWSALGDSPSDGVNGSVYALAFKGRDLYVGGAFLQAGGRSARRIVRWNGLDWRPLGTGNTNGVNAPVRSLAVAPNGVYLGGDFTEAGGAPASHVALWEYPTEPQRGVLLTGHVEDDGLPTGQLSVQWQKVSGPGTPIFVNSTSAVTSVTFDQLGTYVLRLSANDTEFTTLEEVTITLQGNQPPIVSAGTNQVVGAGGSALLAGSIADDGLPVGEEIASAWSVINGPGTVDFENIGDPQTTARFDTPGTYILRLSANDSQFTSFADITVIVLPPNSAPSVQALAWRNFGWGAGYYWEGQAFMPAPLPLGANINDDLRPSNILVSIWSQISGPGHTLFDNTANLFTSAVFTEPGTYILRLTVSDTELTSFSDIPIEVYQSGQFNQSPRVWAGNDQHITLPASATLAAQAVDDGPLTNLTFNWHMVNGPGVVLFSDADAATTTASFNRAGTYELAVDVSDGDYWSYGSDHILVIVESESGINRAPLVAAGPPQTGVIGRPVSLGGVVIDDGLPLGVAVTSTWSLLAGPASVIFANSNTAQSTVTCDTIGDYLFQLAASDTEFVSTNTVSVRIVDCEPDNLPPVANAGPDQILTDNYAYLPGAVSDDGKTGGIFGFVWSQVGGPLPASFNPYSLENWVGLPVPGKYVFRLGAQDGSYTSGDDVIIERQAAAATNQAPVVDAGAPQTLLLPTNQVTLAGSVADDSGNALVYHWEVAYAPGEVIFDDTNSLTPMVTFLNPPIDYDYGYPAYYDLRLVAEDGENYSSSAVTIIVGDTNVSQGPLFVDAGPDQTITLPQTITLTGQTDGSYLYWTQVSGPICNFQGGGGGSSLTATALSTSDALVTFAIPGTYRFRCIANGWNAIGADDVVITVLAASNLPPTVVAGPPRTLVAPTDSVVLEGLAIDDGYPTNVPLTSHWEVVTAPAGGTAIFAQPDQLVTTASFSLPGSYKLLLAVSDSEFTVSNETTITLAAPVCVTNLPPLVDAGPDATVTMLELFNLNGAVSDDGFPLNGLSQSWSVVSGPVNPEDPGAGVSIWYPNQAVTPVTFAYPGTYVLRLTATDGSLANADDITITINSTTNTAPQVFAGYPRLVNRDEPVQLNGLVWDDGNPANAVAVEWSVLGDPAAAIFTNANSTNAVVMFPALGQYTLRLSANDSVLSAYSDVVITVTISTNGNYPPQVTTGGDITAISHRSINLPGYVSDDGLPTNGHLMTLWGQVNGPGTVRFGNALLTNSPATFYVAGTYILQLTASDSQLSAGANLTVTVSDPTNEPPLVYAGGNLVVTRPAAAELDGYVLDDDQPLGYPLLFQWSKVSGPGTATFTTSSNIAANVTPWQEVDFYDALAFASFSTHGTYVLRLTGTDTQYTNTDEVTITVLPGVNSAPAVYAGPDQSISLPYPATLYTDITDDGLENGTVQISWNKVSGPGLVSFSTVNGVYRATFNTTGEYVLRLTANDGVLSASDDVTVTVYDVAAPLAEITAPVDGGIITAPAAIVGTASSTILQSYVLEYRLAPPPGGEGQGEVAWSVLASNTVSVLSNTLAIFDPTLLLNGIYELCLTATDFAGRSTVTEPITVIVDRNLKIGHFTVSFNDLTVPVAGLPLQITRTYDSRAAAAGIQGDFGIGWTLAIRNVRLQKSRSLSRNWEQTTTGSPWDLSLAYHLNGGKPRIVSITFPDGRVEKFQFLPNPMDQALVPIDYPQWRFVPIGNTRGSLVPAGYDEPDGHFLAFSGIIPGTADLYDLNYFFDWINGSGTEEDLLRHPTLFRYSTPEGYKYLIDEIAGLQSVTDPNGNTLLISTNGLTWTNSLSGTNSLSIAFQRDTQGRITNIVDAAGYSIRYAYSANGNLVSYTNRVGKTNGFAYTNVSFAHHLTGIFDGRGTNVLENTFDASGRLVVTADALGYVTGFGNDISANRTMITNRLGFVTINDYDELGRVVRKTDPLGVVTTYTYDAADNLITVSNGACSCATHYTYDGFDNPISQADELGNTVRYTYTAVQKVSSYIDEGGNVTTNTYDARGNLLTTRDPLGAVTSFAYDAFGQVVQMTDPRGGISHYQYDAQGRLVVETNALGEGIVYTVDANGNLTSSTRQRTLDFTPSFSILSHDGGETLMCNDTNVTHYRNIVPSYSYDAAGHLIAVVLPDGVTICTVSYDANGKVSSTTNQLGLVTTTEYDAVGKPSRISYPDGTTEDFSYDAESQLITHIDRGGRQTRFSYDPNGRLAQVVYPNGRAINATYDFRGRLITEVDAHHGTNTYTYDAIGNRISATDPAGNITRYTYNSKRACTSVTDALGRVTTLDYDALNRNTRITYPNGQSKSAEYAGRLVTSVINEEGFASRFDYDAMGRLVSAANAHGRVTRFQYDELNHLVVQTDPLGESTFHDYDDLGRRVRTTLPDGDIQQFTYDALGRLTSTTDAAGNTSRFGYNARNNLIAATNSLGEVTRFTYNNLGQQTSRTEPNGQLTQWEYDPAGRRERMIYPDGSRAETHYDGAGRIAATIDRAGGQTSFQYNVLDQIVSLNDPLSRSTTFGYDAVGNLTSQVDASGQTTRFLFDKLNRQAGIVLPDGGGVGRSFNSRGNLAAQTNQLGQATQFGYDDNGRVTSVTDPLGSATQYGYDSRGQLTGITNALGNATTYVYDPNGRLTQTIRADGSVEQVAYDSRGLVSSRTDVLGHQMYYGHDGAGRLMSVTNALGFVTRYDRDSLGRVISQTDANGLSTSFVYDATGNLIRTTYADGTFESASYDTAGRLVAETNANGNVTFYGYDVAGQLVSVTNALGEVGRFAYDSLGRRIQSIDALGRTNRFDYDAQGRLTRVTFPDETCVSHLYDAAGRRTALVDEAGVTNLFGYDAAGRLTSVTNALGQVTAYHYDAVGQLAFEVDANGHTNSYTYDALSRRVSRTLPGGQFETFAYDAAGNLTNRTDFNGRQCSYEYDAINQTLRKIPDPFFSEPPVTWAYDPVGLRTNMTDTSGATAYRYDSQYRLLEKRRLWSDSGTSASLLYGYDTVGNVTNVVSAATNGTALAYTYDPLNRLAAVIDPLNGTTAYAYDPVGNLTRLTRPNSLQSIYTYDSRDRATNVITLDATLAAVSQYLYQYNPAGHRVATAETVVANGVPSTIQRAFGYDGAYRLIAENLSFNSQLATLNYSYDGVGNRLTRTSTLVGLTSQSFTYDDNDQLISDTYDANGNTLTSPAAGMVTPDQYDHADRLIARMATINSQPATLSFQYDGDGNRVARTLAGVTTHFLTDEVNPTGWPQVLEEHTWIPGDPTFGTPAVTRTYSYGHAPLSQDQIAGAAWSASHFGHDAHGNVRYLSGAGGAVTDTFDYDAFGSLIGRTGETPVTRLFTGEEYDAETGLYNLRARYHNPNTGRFWTRDNFTGFMERPTSRNGYTYAENNPVNFGDPSGHFALAESMAVSGFSMRLQPMLDQLWKGALFYSHGLGGGESLKAVNKTEAFFIQGLSQHVGINLGRQNFFTAMQGAPFLLAQNPFVYYAPNDCFQYQIIGFLPDAPIYGCANLHPVFGPVNLKLGLEVFEPILTYVDIFGSGLGLNGEYQGYSQTFQGIYDHANEMDADAIQADLVSGIARGELAVATFGTSEIFGSIYEGNPDRAKLETALLLTGLAAGRVFSFLDEGTLVNGGERALPTSPRNQKLIAEQVARENALRALVAEEAALRARRLLPTESASNNTGPKGLAPPKQCLQLPAPRQPIALLPGRAESLITKGIGYDWVASLPKGSRPDPSTYLPASYIQSHLAGFQNGVVKLAAEIPTRPLVGPPGGTYVISKTVADRLILEAGGDVSRLEKLLALEPGTLGQNPVRIDISQPTGLRLPNGNEIGANQYWKPGGFTAGGVPEAAVDPVPINEVIVNPVFKK